MGLYTLRKGQRASPLHKLGNIGAVSYPVPIRHGETWRGQFKFSHQGPAESLWVAIGPYVEGTEHLSYATISVGEDAVEQEYITSQIAGTFDSHGLPHCRRIDTNMYIYNSDGSQTYAHDSSTERFHNEVISRSFEITQDRYANPDGWAGWMAT